MDAFGQRDVFLIEIDLKDDMRLVDRGEERAAHETDRTCLARCGEMRVKRDDDHGAEDIQGKKQQQFFMHRFYRQHRPVFPCSPEPPVLERTGDQKTWNNLS